MEQPQFVEHREPEDVFTLVSDENRIDILRALWEGDGEMAFSELQDAVDIGDSGQFNYHLDKLVGQFVKKTDEGYALTSAGDQINGAIEAGSYTATGAMEPISLDETCPTCGGDRTFYYEDEQVRVECDACEVLAQFTVPPSTFVDCDRNEIPRVAGQYLQGIVDRLDKGFCSQCDGPVEQTVCRLVDTEYWDPSEEFPEEVLGDPREIPIVQYECNQCGMTPTSGLSLSLLDHPVVVGFYHDHGIDIRERSIWKHATFGAEYEAVRRTDPFRATTTFRADGDELTVTVDEDLSVVETELSGTENSD